MEISFGRTTRQLKSVEERSDTVEDETFGNLWIASLRSQ